MPRTRAVAVVVAAALVVGVLVTLPTPASSAGGALDTTFSTAGSVTHDFNGVDVVSDLVLQGDGKIVVTGASSVAGFGLARYTTAGVLDTTFATVGFTSGAFMTDARGLALQTDGKVLVAGRSAASGGSLVVARYTTAGALDATFDTDGRVSVAMAGANSGGVDVAVQNDGKIVALAIDGGALNVVRFETSGALDTTFDTDGRVVTTATPSLGDRVAIQTDGKIVITGTSGGAGGLLRFLATGAADTTFDTDGVVTTANHVARGVVVQSDGRTVTVGDFGSSATSVMVTRRNTDGSLDPTFGTSGVATIDIPTLTSESADGVVLQADGRIVIVGRRDDAVAASPIFVARLTTAGVLDSTFATNGVATFTTIATKNASSADGIAVDTTGRLVVGGSVVSTSGNDNDFVVLRVLVTDTPVTTTTSTSSTTTTTVPGTVAAGGTLTSDPGVTAPTASNTLLASVTSPVAGTVTFLKETGTAVVGYRTLSGVTITAPAGTPAAPLRISFALDASTFPASLPLGGVVVLRDSVSVADCTITTSATPDPCVLSRSRVGDDIAISVLTSTASNWKLVQPVVQRIAGVSRVESAIAASRSSFADGAAESAVVVRADGFADALAATPLAVAKNGPLLLSSTDALDDVTLAEITRVLPVGGTVYLLGGTGALSPAVASRIESWGYTVVRYAGANRYETAVVVAEEGLDSPMTVIETTGLTFADALAAGAVAAKTGGAVLLTDGSNQTPATARYLATHQPTRYALGGPAADADPGATAVVGTDRYETAVLAAIRFFEDTTAVGIASGQSFPDALAGGSHAGLAGGPLLLVPPAGDLPVSVAIYLRGSESDPPAAFLYGGTGAVGDDVAAGLQTALGG